MELIATEDRERLEADQQIIWDLNKACEVSGYTRVDMTKILQVFKKQLDIDNGGCVFYPYAGGKYRIESLKFTRFLRNNFPRIMKELKSK
ncbi:hypothetical protein FC71_GL001027 [Latilactobacillus sakei subsp. carnosus DSM 15831]|nr:hypothetical protein FC71_GL001027 [Latilactobacillus sakei subsp. carnosus DSM 15831]